MAAVLPVELTDLARDAGHALRDRGETVAVAEGSCGGLISAALLSVAGASAYYLAGAVIYTPRATKALLAHTLAVPPGIRGATEEFASYLADASRTAVGATWGIGEGGATGPSPNPYGDPAGHAWTAVAHERGAIATRRVLTGDDDRLANMAAFAAVALSLLLDQLTK